MERFSAIKERGGLLRATTWVNVETLCSGKDASHKNYRLCDSTDTNGPGVIPTETERWGWSPGLALGGRATHVTILRCPSG